MEMAEQSGCQRGAGKELTPVVKFAFCSWHGNFSACLSFQLLAHSSSTLMTSLLLPPHTQAAYKLVQPSAHAPQNCIFSSTSNNSLLRHHVVLLTFDRAQAGFVREELVHRSSQSSRKRSHSYR